MLSVLLSTIVNAQIPEKAFPLTNSLNDLWYKGETEKAIENSLELYKLYPPFLIENIHNTLAQQFQNKDAVHNSSVFIEQLYLRNNLTLNEIIRPIYLWNKVINTSDSEKLMGIVNELEKCLTDSSNYQSHTERYCLLVLNEMDSKMMGDKNTKKKLLLKVISNLETYPYLVQSVSGRKALERAWNRYLLAYSYFYLYSKFDNKEEYLMKASNYSPDKNDVEVKHAYSYEASLLAGNTGQIGFKMDYLNYLKAEKNTQKALILLTEIAFGEPSDNNLEAIQNYYHNLSLEKPFNDYWHQYINLNSTKAPNVKVVFPEGVLDLTEKPGRWIYIDVWGTWCSPCVKELPGLQSLFIKNSQDSKSKLSIYSFSFFSQNLVSFMNDNKYTFPVSEIDKPLNDAFEVTGYPTKILITPEGYYLKIPFNVDWKLYIKNYCLM